MRSRWSQGPQPRRIRKAKTRAALRGGKACHMRLTGYESSAEEPGGVCLASSAAGQREYLDVRVVGKTPRPAETTTRHCQPGGEGHTFGADSESEFLGLQLWASTPVASPAALRHHPRQEPRALTRMRGSVRGDWRKPVPYRDVRQAN